MSTPLFPRADIKKTATELWTELTTANPDRFERELVFESWVDQGHVPDFMTSFWTLEIRAGSATIYVDVSRDYLCFGTDDDYVRTPVFPTTAQRILDRIDCMVPTTKIADEIWKQAATQTPPRPWGPPYDASMMDTSRILEHNKRINVHLDHTRYTPGTSLAGHKKDIVLSRDMQTRPEQVWIYGWHKIDGSPIQPLSGVHEKFYCDYSHGLRLISKNARLWEPGQGTKDVQLPDLLKDFRFIRALSLQGILDITKYPTQ
jgi:hypothetical protein